MSTEYPVGCLYHWSSKMRVHPKGSNDPNLVVKSDKKIKDTLEFRFVAVEGAGHFGYIEQVKSGKIVHPKEDSLKPSNNTHLVLRSERHAGALFGFDESNNLIWHKHGKAGI